MRISWSIGATTYCYLKCIVYDKLLKPLQSFVITLNKYKYIVSVFLFYVYVWLLWLRFFRAFSLVVRQMPGWNPQRRGTACTLPNFCVVLCIVCFVSFCVLFVCICVLYYCHRVATQSQLTNLSYFSFIDINLIHNFYTNYLKLSSSTCFERHPVSP